MRTYDAVIVGGGPAGSTFARQMVQAGGRPVILDREHFPRVKLCAGWITPPVLDAVEIDRDDYERDHTLQEFRGFNIWRLSGREVLAEYDRAISYGIVRSELDEYLLRRSGAEVHEGVEVCSIRREGRDLVVNDRWRAPLLIGAGGHFCPVARFLGVSARNERCLVTLELERRLPPEEMAGYRVDPERPELAYFDDFRGYGWCFRKGPFMNIGVGRTRPEKLREYLVTFLRRLLEKGKVPPDTSFTAADFRGHAYKLHFVTPRPYLDEGVLLIGDSAGLTYNFSGEGIRPAVESARLAFEVVGEAGGDYSRARLAPYRDRLYARFGRPITGWRSRALEALPSFWFRWVGRALLGVPRWARGVAVDRMFLHHDELEEAVRPRLVEGRLGETTASRSAAERR
jgi:flavin-dependent dehydrogenase